MSKLVKEWYRPLLLLVFILLGAFILRVINLTILPVFADEAIYIRWAQIMGNEPTLRFLPLSDGKQPLYMWILMFIVRHLHDPLFAGRLISVVAGLGTVVGLFASSFLVFKSKRVALISAVLWAISPFSFFFDRMALVDSLLAMFAIWTFFFGVLTSKTKRIDAAMLAGFSLGFAWLTKSPALFLVLLLPTTWLLSSFPKKSRDRGMHLAQLFGLFVITFVIGFGMYNILRLGPNFHMIATRNLDYVWPITHFLQSPLDPLKPHFIRSMEYLWTWGPSVIFVFIVAGIVVNLKKNWKTVLVLVAWSFGPVIINSEFAKVLTARYILFTLPFFFMLAASSFTKEKLKNVFYMVLVVYVVHALTINYALITNPWMAPMPRTERSGYLEEWTSGIGIREVSGFLKAEQAKNPEQKIVVGTEGYFGTLPDGLQLYMQDVPQVTVIGVGLHIGQIPVQLKESVDAGNKTYLVANSSRLNFKGEFEENGLKVVKEFRKADRPTDVREYVQYGLHDTFYLLEVLPE